MNRVRVLIIRLALALLRRFADLRVTSEAEDILAMLRRRRANCDTMIAANAPEADRARVMRSELDWLIGEISAGMHHGEADVAAAIGGLD